MNKQEALNEMARQNGQAFYEGRLHERERIIKLLDVLATQEPPFAQMLISNLKLLIKGENK